MKSLVWIKTNLYEEYFGGPIVANSDSSHIMKQLYKDFKVSDVLRRSRGEVKNDSLSYLGNNGTSGIS